jgi:phage-related protein
MNGYSDGFNAGYADGKNRKSKNYQRHIQTTKALISSNYVDTFIQGYDDGFSKGILDKNREG